MADRLFAGALLLIALGYAWIAFTLIKAPIQYDPIGPESWPRILSSLTALCLIAVILAPSADRISVDRRALIRLGATLALLFGYAFLYRPLGFPLATWGFCSAMTLMLGARPAAAALFGGAVAILAYAGATELLDLNLPAGPVLGWLRG
jgi:putative tricarboxylic transport membrane protein